MLPLTSELRPKWNKNNKNKNAVSRSDPLQGSDNDGGDHIILISVIYDGCQSCMIDVIYCGCPSLLNMMDVHN